MKLILYIVYNNKTIEYPLPAITDRRHLIYLPDIDNECCISVEFFDNVWTVNESENISLFADRHNVSSFILESGKILNIKYKDLHEISLIVQEITENEMTFIKYDISAVGKIRIGQDDVCEITLNNPFISKHHAIIGMVNGEYFISDQSTNGTYINGERIKGKTPLKIFDSIYTVGLKVVFLGNILAVSKTPGIKVNLPEADISEKIMREKKDNGGVIVFSTSPRRIEQLEPADISIDLPPAKNNQREQPLIFMLGPSLTMPIPMFVSVMMNMALTGSSSIERLIMSLSSIIASSGIGLGWALARRQYAKKVKAEDEKIRTEAYKKYLDKTSEFLMDKHIINRNTLNLMYPPTNELIGIIEHDNSKLWNHSPRQKDFLTLRLGKGFVDYPGNIKLPAERFSVRNDELAEKPYEIYESFRYIKDAVSLIELKKHKIVGVIGNNRDVGSIASNLLIQIAAAYSYLDVKTAIFYDDSYRETFAWAKWLPHTFSPDKKIRMIARDRASSQGILYYLSTELRKRSEDEKKAVMLPYYVVFCTSPTFFEDEVIEKYINSENQLGICFILLYGESVLLPNTCKYVIRCDTEFKGRYALDERRTLVNSTDFDSFNISEADTFARKISGMYIKELSTGEIPSSVEYLDMIGIGNVEQWDLLRHYKENRVYEHIRSFIGITVGNKPMYLDIHEKKYGPHGLVAGTTGSGKSETIQTFIISLAMNYHPNEVAFILIDYKGGGMANAFIGMPHLAGTITNLSDMNDDNGETEKDKSVDSSQTRRALISIKSEIKRRQAIFNQYKVNHIDLYIRLFREGKAQEPLPHLIIISDEFAELKKEQPEFIKELVSTARVGRSLGIHLILATQKPAGVVDDEIWSNSRFKICLRVQD
ncbi:MAG: FtsK/SpoIIIE domain-containing protein, partial [Oscillospiraceae bacterium]